MEMHRGLLVTVLVALLVALFGTASALPPDFFRNGLVPGSRRSSRPDPQGSWWGRTTTHRHPHRRLKRGDQLPEKRSSWESDMISKSCHFCSYISPSYNFECRKNIGNRRRECIMAYKIEFDDYITEKGWK